MLRPAGLDFRFCEDAWLEYLRRVGMPNSGIVDRFYFRSLYFRVANGILFEITIDGPGFATDEPASPCRLFWNRADAKSRLG